ncbi:MAG: putative glycosyltransferase, exosortase G system-associated [Chloroflexi bacterium]|nr:putative glycosyltransferase, exosortase G system-associated [Chloroflexota bacterium]
MTNSLLTFVVFWGIWLLVPILVDGATSLAYLIGAWRGVRNANKNKRFTSDYFFPPIVTIIVPVYNGQRSLGACLRSIRDQSYPQECLQVIVVNNQSTDESFSVFGAEQGEPFGGTMAWVDTTKKGKVWALNTGIHLAHGTIIMNVDCDTVLHPNAILNMAKAFEAQPDLAAATGAIQVEARHAVPLPPWKAIWADCEAMEYIEAFQIGRQYQSATNSLFTLAGAFSAFRREVLLQTFLYDQQTVSEDTKMTLDVRRSLPSEDMRIGCVADAVAFVEPTLSISRLYAQRVRWQRGQLEVAALQPRLSTRDLLRINGLSITRTLIIDHTLAFPRLVWTFLLPLLYFFGYPLPLVANATIGMYAFYAVIESFSILTCYMLGDRDVKRRVREKWYLWVFLPAYRFALFWFRFGGFLNVLTDEAQWRVTDPWQETRAGLNDLTIRIKSLR